MQKFLLLSCSGPDVFVGFRFAVAKHVNLEIFVEHGIFTTIASLSVIVVATINTSTRAVGSVGSVVLMFHRRGYFFNAVGDLNIRHIVVDQGL